MHCTVDRMRREAGPESTIIRYKNYAIKVDFMCGPCTEGFVPTLWVPIESEEETGIDFEYLRLENISEWENEIFNTEGEAIAAVISYIECYLAEGFLPA